MYKRHCLYYKLESPSQYLENLTHTLGFCALIYPAESLMSDTGCNITTLGMTLLRDDFQSPKEYL